MQILSNEDAVKIAANLFLWYIVNTPNQSALTMPFVKHYGQEYLSDIITKMKYELYADEKLKEVAFKILD